jgi:hypothetical protein
MTFNKNGLTAVLVDKDIAKLTPLVNEAEDKFRLFTKYYINIEDFIRIIPTLTERRYVRTKDEM